MAISGVAWGLFLLSRLLFGGVIAFIGLNHFQGTEEMVGYAEFKGLPAPKLGVLGSGVLLVLGGISIGLGVFPVVGGVAVALFLVVAAVVFHDFWAVGEDEAADELNHFLKNVAMAGGALVFAVLGLSGAWTSVIVSL